MAAPNRYTNLSTAQFNPLSTEEIFSVPMAMRGQHDLMEQQADELGIYDINRLDVDDPLVKNIINQEQNKLNEFVDELSSKGFNSQTKSQLRNLSKRKRNLMSNTGVLGKAQSAYNAYQANAKELQDMYKKGNISADKYQLGISKALQDYKGIVQNDSYNPFTGVADTDYVEQARKIANDIRQKPDLLEQAGYYLMPNNPSMYVKYENGQEFTRDGAIADAVVTLLGNDSNVMSDLAQREELGILGNKSASDVIKDIALGLEKDYSINREKKSIGLIGNKGYKSPDEINNGNTPFTSLPVQNKNRFEGSIIDKLRKVGSIDVNANTKSFNGVKGMGFPITETTGVSTELVTVDSALDDKEKERYNIIKDKLQNSGIISLNDPKAHEKVANYMEQFKDMSYTDRVVQTAASDNSLDSALLLDTRKIKNVSEYLEQQVKLNGDVKLYDPETKKQVDPKDLDFKDGNFSYVGYVSPDNFIEGFEDANESLTVVPDVFIYTDADGDYKTLYANKSKYQMDKPSFKAASLINNIHKNTSAAPLIQEQFVAPKELQKKGVYNINVRYNPSKKPGEDFYTIQLETVHGSNIPESKSREEFKEIIYSLYGDNK